MAHPHSSHPRHTRPRRRLAVAALLPLALALTPCAADPDASSLPQPISNSPLDLAPSTTTEPRTTPDPLSALAESSPSSPAAPIISPREKRPLGSGAPRSTPPTHDPAIARTPAGAPPAIGNREISGSGGGGWLVQTGAALALVIALIFTIKWAAQRLARHAGGLAWQLGPAGRAPSGLLEVLGRFPVSRGHSLILLKLDRRILLLGQSASGFTTLSQVTDPEEVASLIIKSRDDEGASMAARFNEILHDMERDPAITGDDAPDISPGDPATGPRLPRIRLNAVTA